MRDDQILDPRSKLPVDHPDYLYPPSRNPYYQKIAELQSQAGHTLALWDADTEKHAGHWRELFGDHAQHAATRKLHVEVGCNAGHVVLENAKRNPTDAFIGIDWKIKMIHWAAEKTQKRGLRNMIFARAHANRLGHLFGPEEIDTLSIFFPDPWPTKSQWKNRWITDRRLRAIAPLMKRGGEIWIKTDHDAYFEWICEAAAACGELFTVKSKTLDLHAGHSDPTVLQIPEVTLFERLFIKDGIPIKELRLVRN